MLRRELCVLVYCVGHLAVALRGYKSRMVSRLFRIQQIKNMNTKQVISQHSARINLSVLLLFTCGLINAEIRINGIAYFLHYGSGTAEVSKSSTGYSGDIYIPSTVTYGGETFTVTTIEQYAFSEQNITSVSFPNTLNNIENNAFYNCKKLQRVSFGNSIKSIGPTAFCGCINLTSISLPNSVQVVDRGAFLECI